MVADRPWFMGDGFAVADPYRFVFYPCAREPGLPVGKLTSLTSMKTA